MKSKYIEHKVMYLTGALEPASSPASDYTVKFKAFTFKGGEPHIKIEDHNINEQNTLVIYHRIANYADMGLLKIAVDALKRMGYKNIQLMIPYFPGARQDRLMVEGEPFTSAVYVKDLHSLGFNTIFSMDMHSDVVAGMFAVLGTRFIDIPNHEFILSVYRKVFTKSTDTKPYLVSPDAGSNKKIDKLAKYLSAYNRTDVVKCDKTRDVTTGEITNFEVYAEDLQGRDCVIVDDICDGGGTFLGLAEQLKAKNAGRIYLVVTHGIFSRGIKPLTDVFDGVYCSNSCDAKKYHEGIVSSKFEIIYRSN